MGGGEGCATLWPFVGGQSPGAHTLQGGTWWAADQALCPSLRRSLSVSPHLSVESVNQTKAAQGKVRVHNSRFWPARGVHSQTQGLGNMELYTLEGAPSCDAKALASPVLGPILCSKVEDTS